MGKARLAALLALALGVACGSDSYGNNPPPGCTPTSTQLCAVNTAFNPSTKTVSAAGATLTWKNGDGFAHTTTSDASNPAGCPTWNQTLAAGQTSNGVTFGTASVVCNYHCEIHSTMHGSITVP